MRHRIPSNSKIRRQLFPADNNIQNQANIDNSANILRELIAKDRQKALKKYNFDTSIDEPLPGDWEWSKDAERGIWIGRKKEKGDPNEHENEKTPHHVRDNSVPPLRKRKRDVVTDIGNPAVRRRLLDSED